MALNFRKFFEGLKIIPKTSSTADAAGEMDVTSGNGKLNYHNGTTPSPIVTEAHASTLTNKTIDGDDNTIQDLALASLKTVLADANKVIQRDASGIVVSGPLVPAGSGDLVRTDSTQTLTNKTIDGDNNTVQDLALTSLKTVLADANKVVERDASGIVVSGQTRAASAYVGVSDTQALTNKTIDGDLNTVQDLALTTLKTDGGNANKFIQRDGSGIVVNGPAVPTGPVVGTTDTQTLTNKSLVDASTSIIDDGDNTKIAKFQASGITTGTTRTFTFPDANTTLVGTDTTQTLTNKTLTSPTLSSPLITNFEDFTDQASSPSAPASGKKRIYAKDDGKWYSVDAAGTETPFALGSSFGINYISNSDAEGGLTGWAQYDDRYVVPDSDISAGADTITITAHGFVNNDVIAFGDGSVDPGGLTAGTYYYAVAVTTNNFKLAATPGGAPINITSSGTGPFHFAARRPINGTGGTSSFTFAANGVINVRGQKSFHLTTSNASLPLGQGVSFDYIIDNADKSRILEVSFDYVASNDRPQDPQFTVFAIDTITGEIIDLTPSGIVGQKATNPAVGGRFVGYYQANSGTSSGNYRFVIHCSTSNYAISDFAFDNVRVSPATQQSLDANLIAAKTYFTTPVSVTNDTNVPFDTIEYDTNNAMSAGVFTAPVAGKYHISGVWQASVGSNIYVAKNGAQFNYLTDAGGSSVRGFSLTLDLKVNDTVSIRPDVTTTPTVNARFCIERVSAIQTGPESKIVAAKTTRSGNTSVTNDTVIPFNVITYDTNNAMVNGVYTAPVAGKYRISGVAAPSTVGNLYYTKNGTGVNYLVTIPTSSLLSFSDEIDLMVGDTIDLRYDNTSIFGVNSKFCISRISGPDTITPNETIVVRYVTTSTNAISPSTPVNFDLKVYDTHNAVTTGAGWKFTAPISGYYQINITVLETAAANQTIEIFKNGTVDYVLMNTISNAYFVSGSALIKMKVNDYIDIRAGAAVTLNSDCTVTINKVGN